MDNPFADLIPQQAQQAAPQAQQQANPFADLIPASPVSRATAAPQKEPGFFDKYVAAKMHGPAILMGAANNTAKIPVDPYKAMGVNKGLGDEIIQGGLEFAPYLMGAGGAGKLIAEGVKPFGAKALQKTVDLFAKRPNLTKNVSAGIAYGYDRAPEGEKGTGAIIGGASGAAGVGAGKAVDAATRYGAKKYAQSAIPGLVERASESIKKHITPEKSAQILQNKYSAAAKVNEQNWQKTNDLAGVLDKELKMRGHRFDGSRFIQDIDKGIAKIQRKEPAKRAKYENAIGFANYIKEQTPQSFSGAITLRQNLNQQLKSYLDKNNIKQGDRETKELIGNLKNVLSRTIKDNKNHVGQSRFNKFESVWEQANKSHGGLQDFYRAPTPEGTLKPIRQRREALESGILDPLALGKYLRPSLGGTAGINQLGKLTGNNNAARAHVMRNVIEGRGKENAALSLYEKLSPQQRQALFDKTPYGEQLNAASIAKNTVGEAPSEGWRAGMHHVGSMGMPGLLGFLGAKTIGGEDWDTSLAVGLGAASAAKGGGKLASKFASPSSVIKAANRAKTPNKNSGRYLSPVLASMFTPQERNQ